MKFPCAKCGACCKNPVIADVCPELDRGDGVCVHLTDENECAIYETRPDYCRLDVLYSQRYADKITEDEFCEWYSHDVCHNLQMHGAELEENRQKKLLANRLYSGEISVKDIPADWREEIEKWVANRKALFGVKANGKLWSKGGCSTLNCKLS